MIKIRSKVIFTIVCAYAISGCIKPNPKGPPGSFLSIDGKSHCYYNKEACKLAGGDDLYNAIQEVELKEEQRFSSESRARHMYSEANRRMQENQKLQAEQEQKERSRQQAKEDAWSSLSKQEVEALAKKNHIIPLRVFPKAKHPIFIGLHADSINTFINMDGRKMTAGVVTYSPDPDIEPLDPRFIKLAGIKFTAKPGLYMAVDCQNGWAETGMSKYGPIQKYNPLTSSLTDDYILAGIICSNR